MEAIICFFVHGTVSDYDEELCSELNLVPCDYFKVSNQGLFAKIGTTASNFSWLR